YIARPIYSTLRQAIFAAQLPIDPNLQPYTKKTSLASKPKPPRSPTLTHKYQHQHHHTQTSPLLYNTMRKSAGIGALTRTTAHTQKLTSHGLALQQTTLTELSTQLSVFRAALSQFARTHAADIRSSPTFRSEFARMCTAIGVDPLASSSDKKGSFWAELLGGSVNDFYFELAVRVVEVCRLTREENGGLVDVEEVRTRLARQRKEGGGEEEVSSDDIERAVEALGPLGGGFGVVSIGGRKWIRSVPKELNGDQSTVLEVIQVLGYVTFSMLRVNLSWDNQRIETVIDDLLSDGLVWVDEQAKEKEFWSPGFFVGK
ncbi:ESCRT II complex subunit Dot2, partial [Rhizina undulata]